MKVLKSFAMLLVVISAMVPVLGAAHDVYVYEGADYATVRNGHTEIYMCDQESDGNPAYARFFVNDAQPSIRLDDPNGSQPGCGFSAGYYYITTFRVCEGVPFGDPCSAYVAA